MQIIIHFMGRLPGMWRTVLICSIDWICRNLSSFNGVQELAGTDPLFVRVMMMNINNRACLGGVLPGVGRDTYSQILGSLIFGR